MRRKRWTGWYNALYEWYYGHPLTAGILCTALTLGFAWAAFAQLRESSLYVFLFLVLGIFQCIGAVSYFKLACRRRRRRLAIAESWPAEEGYIAELQEKVVSNGILVVEVAYTYEVAGQRYTGRESFSFVRDEDAATFGGWFKERVVRVHYRLNNPSVSVLDLENIRT